MSNAEGRSFLSDFQGYFLTLDAGKSPDLLVVSQVF